MTHHLLSFWHELTNQGLDRTPQQWFDALAYQLMNNLRLTAGRSSYRITECEFYYSDIDHADPFIHAEPQQMTAGQLYLNKAGGLDITFGNAAYPAFGGILIRGIRNLETGKYINQITKITAEMFRALGNILQERGGIYLEDAYTGAFTEEKPIQTTRVGLQEEKDGDRAYIDLPYRYIVELTREHQFKGREGVIKQLLKEGRMTPAEAKEILDYNVTVA
jgi:hypothetical protein